jgi:hypothetical protein
MKSLAFALVFTALASSASAAQADPSAADRVTARALMAKGRELRDKGDLKGALEQFKGADDIMHAPTTALEMAKTQVALGRLVEARDTIATIRRSPVQPKEPLPFREARNKADALDTELAGRVPVITIALKDVPEGEKVKLSIDGEGVASGAASLPRSVNPGHHVVVATSESAEGKAEVDVREGEQKPVEVALVSSETEDEQAEAPQPEAPPPPQKSHRPTLLTWSAAGVALAGVGVGTVAGILSLSKKSALSSECTRDICGPSSYGDYDAANSLATVSTVGFVVAGVGAAAAVVTLVVGHGGGDATPPPSQASFVPWFGPGAAGVSGRF